MAYEGHRASLQLAYQALRKSFVFSGRATRTEFAAYYLATLVVGIAIGLPALFLLEYAPRQLLGEVYGWLSGIPFVALMVRRLHDQNRTGWWVLFPLAAVGFSTAFRIVALTVGIQDSFELRRAIGHADWLVLLIAIGAFVAILAEGDAGTNRFGPNPRLDNS